jgi:hypothetical protein
MKIPEITNLPYSLGLVPCFYSRSGHQDQFSGLSQDQPIGQFQTDSSQPPNDDVRLGQITVESSMQLHYLVPQVSLKDVC